MTQLEAARNGLITEQMKLVARDEALDPEKLRLLIAKGQVVIPANINHTRRKYYGIGQPLSIKINVNLGTSPGHISLEDELAKLRVAEQLGAEAAMDLSVAGNLNQIRQAIIERAQIMIGTVPIYQNMVEYAEQGAPIDADALLKVIELHGRQGVDFITLHCGLRREALPLISKRVAGIVSRGGSFLAELMTARGCENPLYEHFDDILAIARKYDITLSLGDALRPGAIADASDEAQFHELHVLGELVARARAAGVQVMVEGPGHVPLHQIERNMRLQQELCDHAPFYVLGPLTTDIAPGYDHICGAIGGTLAAYYGASFICYVTPAEHLCLPSVEDVREGVIAAKIAAHSADLALGNKRAWERDRQFSEYRKRLDWEMMYQLAIDNCKPRLYRERNGDTNKSECTMCGEYCAMKRLTSREP